MQSRIFIDTNVFIYALEFPESNSAKIISLLNQGNNEAIISERVLIETTSYLEKHQGKEFARKFRRYLLDTCTLIPKREVLQTMQQLKGQIKEKDLEQLAVVKQLGIKHLIAYDKDFEGQEEYTTPKQFLASLHRPITEQEF